MTDFGSHGPQWYGKRISPFLRDLVPVMAEVQVPPGEPRRRRRSANADVGVDPLFGVQFWWTLRGGAANPQNSWRIVAPASSRRLHTTTQHLPHSKSPTFDSPFGTPVKASKQKELPQLSVSPLSHGCFSAETGYHRACVVLERSKMFSNNTQRLKYRYNYDNV
jgi:hypothetical protein